MAAPGSPGQPTRLVRITGLIRAGRREWAGVKLAQSPLPDPAGPVCRGASGAARITGEPTGRVDCSGGPEELERRVVRPQQLSGHRLG
jgi:hypothetical protein